MERNGSYNKGDINPAANQMTGPWSPGQSFQQIYNLAHGASLGSAGFSGNTLVIEAKSAAQGWLANPGQGHGIAIQTRKTGSDNRPVLPQGRYSWNSRYSVTSTTQLPGSTG